MPDRNPGWAVRIAWGSPLLGACLQKLRPPYSVSRDG